MRTIISRTGAALVALVFVGGLLVPSTVSDHEPLVDLTLSTDFEDFNADDGGWAALEVPPPTRPDPTNPSWEWGDVVDHDGIGRPAPQSHWEWGAPTSGPGAAFSGSNVWATNLDGNYDRPHCAGIMSPAIDLTGAGSASIGFQHWMHADMSTTTAWHGGVIFVTTDGGDTLTIITPDGGYPSPGMGTTARACLDNQPTGQAAFSGPSGTTPPPPDYNSVSAGLGAFLGQTVQVVLAFGTDTSGARDGWYIDDFTVTIDAVPAVEDFESSDGGFSIVGVRPKVVFGPGDAASGSNAWATNLGGAHNDNECAALLSPPIAIPAGSTASVSFAQWRHMQKTTATGTSSDAGRLFVTADGGDNFARIDNPTPAYDTGNLLTQVATCFDGITTASGGYSGPFGTALPGPAWSTVSADLTEFAGQTVQLAIAFGSNTATAWSGWYIDDYVVTIDDIVVTSEDFESSDGGFTITTTAIPPAQPKGWSHGNPGTSGPGELDPSDQMWATGIDGNHGSNECHWVESTAIDLTGIADDITGELNMTGLPITGATLRWQQWYRTSTLGAGVIQVGLGNGTYQNVEPSTGYGTGTPSSLLRDCLGIEAGTGQAFTGTAHNALGSPMVDYDLDLTPFLGNEITVRFLFASTSSTTTNPGWYIDNVEVEKEFYLGAPDLPDLPGLGGGANAPLWTSGGSEVSWAYGVVTQSTSNTGLIEGQVGYKTNLADMSNPNECSWIASPAVPGVLVALNPTLSFEQWYRIPGTGVDVAWGGGLVQVSGDGGLTWDYLDLPEYDRPLDYSGGNPACFTELGAPLDGNVFSGNGHLAFETVTVDLSAYASAPTVQVRFVFGTVVFNYEGWFLREIELGGISLLP